MNMVLYLQGRLLAHSESVAVLPSYSRMPTSLQPLLKMWMPFILFFLNFQFLLC